MTQPLIRWILSALLLLATDLVQAQTPFVCRGEYYLTLRSRMFNELFTVEIDPQTSLVTFNPIRIDDGYNLNAMGYRATDNFIYVIDQDETGLLRIDGNGRIATLRPLDELPALSYFAGECTPDGNFLIISGSPPNFRAGSSNLNLIFIDLRDPSYPTRELPLQSHPYLFFDMAFDPFTGICYGYDGNNQVLVEIDVDRGTVRAVGRPGQIANSMGTLFFDAFGNLFGYGRPNGGDLQNTLFAIDKENGNVTVVTTGESADRSDGCSCPFTIKLSKDVSPRVVLPCAEVDFTFSVANASGNVQRGIEFSDEMPRGFEVLEVVRNPFGGTVEDTPDNEIRITGMEVPLGIDSIVVRVRIGEGLEGIYRNQAQLTNLPESLGRFTVSDDPTTIPIEDSTSLQVVPLEIDLSSQNRYICEGDTLVLSSNLPNASYLWQDRFGTNSFVVREPGTYWVEVRSNCDVRFDTIHVEHAPPLIVDVGPDYSVILGDSVFVDPMVTGLSPFSYQWQGTDNSGTISCPICPSTAITPYFSSTIGLEVTDAAGCTARDELDIEVDRTVYIWIPNAFSPNGDGVNDLFYVAGRYPYELEEFSIFSRWGQRLFHTNNVPVGYEAAGWNGISGNALMNPGVYVYLATIRLADGTKQHFAGDLTLIR